MRLLFVASDRMEFQGLLPRLEALTRPALPVHWVREGRLGDHQVLLAANGAGWTRAAAAVQAARDFRPDAAVSTGFCGALDPDLRPGDVVVGNSVRAGGRNYSAATVDGSNAHCGVVVSIDHVARAREEKRKLRGTGACAVEMEAAGVAESARNLGIRLICVRAVTDLADEEMANDFNAALRPDGHFDTIILLKGALRRPASRVPELVRLRSRAVRAARGLGDFFASCRFQAE